LKLSKELVNKLGFSMMFDWSCKVQRFIINQFFETNCQLFILSHLTWWVSIFRHFQKWFQMLF